MTKEKVGERSNLNDETITTWNFYTYDGEQKASVIIKENDITTWNGTYKYDSLNRIIELKKILYGVALATFVLAYFLRKLMVSGRFSGSQGSPFKPVGPSRQPPYLAKYTMAVVVSLAFSESMGIYGLVLFFLGEDLQTLYTFIAISALAMIFFRPKMEELERLASAAKTVS